MINLTAYEDVKIQPNHLIESLDTYLKDHLSSYIFESSILSKDFESDEEAFTIKVKCTGDNANIESVNYVKLEDSFNTRYYFVNSRKKLSDSIWQLALVLDVVNTYQSEVKTTNNFKQVSIKRRHKDRWKRKTITSDVVNYYRVFDRVDEGFDKVTSEIESTRDINDNDYYLVVREFPTNESSSFYNYTSILYSNIYCNKDDDTTYTMNKNVFYKKNGDLCETGSNTRRHILVGTSPIKVVGNGVTIIADLIILKVVSFKSSSTGITSYGLTAGGYSKTADGKYICKGVQSFGNGYYNSQTIAQFEGMESFDWYDNVIGEPNVDGVEYELNQLVGTGTIQSSGSWEEEITTSLKNIEYISKSDSSIKTIINIPVDIESSDLVYWNNGVNCIFNKIITSTKKIDISSTNILKKIDKAIRTRSISYESKLYGSYVRDHYIAYDNFKLPIMPEYLSDSNLEKFEVYTYIPNDMTTNLMIYANIDASAYNNNVLMCSRNNNLSVFTDSYLDYIRNGYNYDEKSKAMSNFSNWMSFGSNLIGTGVGASKSKGNAFMGANVISMGVNTVTSLTNSIMSSIQNEQSLSSKRNQILNSSVSMSGNDNLLLFKKLHWNNINSIQYVVEAPRTEVLNSIWNLFYFTGYADNLLYDVMPTIKTREYFNYVQADIYQCSITDSKIRNRIIAAYGAGITFEWRYNNTYLMEGNLYENWETSI